jgi:DNA-binding MarR family transcriptional regulator
MKKAVAACAQELLEAVPSVMRFIRTQMRSHRALDLSVPQFRSLVFIERTGGASLGEVAENLGLTPPSASVLIDGLRVRGMVARCDSPGDRRRVTLTITREGGLALAQSRAETQESLSAMLSELDAREIARVTGAMKALHRVFAASARTPAAAPAGTCAASARTPTAVRARAARAAPSPRPARRRSTLHGNS